MQLALNRRLFTGFAGVIDMAPFIFATDLWFFPGSLTLTSAPGMFFLSLIGIQVGLREVLEHYKINHPDIEPTNFPQWVKALEAINYGLLAFAVVEVSGLLADLLYSFDEFDAPYDQGTKIAITSFAAIYGIGNGVNKAQQLFFQPPQSQTINGDTERDGEKRPLLLMN